MSSCFSDVYELRESSVRTTAVAEMDPARKPVGTRIGGIVWDHVCHGAIYYQIIDADTRYNTISSIHVVICTLCYGSWLIDESHRMHLKVGVVRSYCHGWRDRQLMLINANCASIFRDLLRMQRRAHQ